MEPNEVDRIMKNADFSLETDLKERLGRRLFSKGNIRELSFEDLEMVSAAGDPYVNKPNGENGQQ